MILAKHHRPLRVLFVESTTEVGGAQVALLDMLRHVDRTRIEPHFVSLSFGNGDLPETVEELQIPVWRLPPGRFREVRKSVQRVRALSRLMVEKQVDIVVSNSGHPLLFARPAGAIARRPVIWWVHGYFLHDAARGYLITFAQQLMGADRLFANSESTARALRVDFPGIPVRMVRYGIDLKKHTPAPEKGVAARRGLGISPTEPVIGIFGRLEPWKGQQIFLRAAAILNRCGLHCRFLVVGGALFGLHQDYPSQLEELARETGVLDRVHFLGQRSDVNALMNACDVVVHASLIPEPWGLVVAEAMAAGRAVVASATGGPLEMIEDERSGLLCPPDNPQRLASLLHRLACDAPLRRSLGEQARRHAENHFAMVHSVNCLASELEAAYRSYNNGAAPSPVGPSTPS